MATMRRSPYTWVTWITGLLAGSDHCEWAAWFKSHFTYDKEPRDSDLASWIATHDELVAHRAEELRATGWTVTIEDQNAFKLRSERTGHTLAGKMDIVAVKGDEVLIVDAKGGQRRDKDIWQVLAYIFVLPLVRRELAGMELRGEVLYKDGKMPVYRLQPADRERIAARLRAVGGDAQLAAVPSQRECQFCDITSDDCKVKGRNTTAAATTDSF